MASTPPRQPSHEVSQPQSAAQRPKVELVNNERLHIEFGVEDLINRLVSRAAGHCGGCYGCSGCSH